MTHQADAPSVKGNALLKKMEYPATQKGGINMNRNVGNIDRVVRLVIAIIFIVANVAGWVNGISGLILAVIAGMLLSSVASAHCPLYVKLGIKKTI